MASTIVFRRGNTFPSQGSGITLAEPVFNTNLNTFHIGLGHGVTAEWIGAPISGASASISSAEAYKVPTAKAVKDYVTDYVTAVNGVLTVNGFAGGVTLSAGTGVSVAASSGTITITNTGVQSFNGSTGAVQGVSAAVAGTGISVSGATGAVTITNTGVQSFNGLTGAVVGVRYFNGKTGDIVVLGGTNIGVDTSGYTYGSIVTVNNEGVLSLNGSTGAITNVARTNTTNTFTQLQTFSNVSGISASQVITKTVQLPVGETNLTIRGSVTPDSSGIRLLSADGLGGEYYTTVKGSFLSADHTITFPDSTGTVALTSQLMGTVNGSTAATNAVTSFNGLTGAVQGVSSINGNTGAISNVAFTNIAQSFSGLQTFTNGISGDGATFGSDISVNGIRVGRGGAGDANSVVIGADVQAGTFNVAIGKSTLLAAVSPSNNVAIGFQSGMSGDSPINNVSIGANSLRFNEFGQGNVAIGYEALYSTRNNANTGVGSMALRSTNTGFRNTSIGNESLYSNTTGVANVAIGHQAGRYRGNFTTFDFPNDLDNEDIFASSRTTGTGGIYIGQWSRASANDTVKEIVIGTEALGLGSNTAVIGATSQVSATIYGTLNLPGGLSASSGATFAGTVSSDTGYRITSSAINTQTGTTYTLLSTDNGEVITFNNASAITVTIPTGLPIGFNCTAIQLGAGQVGFTAASGVTLNSYGGVLKIAGQHGAATIVSYTTNIYNIAGTLTT